MKYIIYIVVWLIGAVLYFIWEFKFLEFPKDLFEDKNTDDDVYDTIY